MTLLERAAAWASKLELADLPERVVQRTRWQIASMVAAARATPWHESARKVARVRSARGQARVFATGRDRSALDAAFVNSCFAMSLDWDDYLLSGHTGHSAIFVPLAHAKTLDEVVVAAAAANEIMGRLSSLCLLGPLNGQMSSYIHNIGAAVALAKVRGLPAEAIAHAMALALSQPNHALIPGFWCEDAKVLTAALPAEQGVRAAQLAEGGLEGPLDLLEHPVGFLSVFAFGELTELFEGFGELWFSDTLSFKRYPGTSYISAAVEGALEASGHRPLAPEEVHQVRVETTLLSATLDTIGAVAIAREPLDANAINFSLRLSVAAALRFGDLRPRDLRPEPLAEEATAIRAIATRIEVVHALDQSLAMLEASPVGPAMIGNLGVGGLASLRRHLKWLAAGTPEAERAAFRLGDSLGALAPFARKVLAGRRGPLVASQLDFQTFEMRQSATTTLVTSTGEETREVKIPLGACGRTVDGDGDRAEPEATVRFRCREAFEGADPEADREQAERGAARGDALLACVMTPGTSIAELVASVEAGSARSGFDPADPS